MGYPSSSKKLPTVGSVSHTDITGKILVAEESTCRSKMQSRLLFSSFPLEEILDFPPG